MEAQRQHLELKKFMLDPLLAFREV
jgi:hypothetical protein